MMQTILALLSAALAAASCSGATIVGFDYGNQKSDGSGLKVQADYEQEFTVASQLVGTNGQYTSARLYTMLQQAPMTEPISAIPAAIATKTSLLLGLWASAGDDAFAVELEGLANALSQYGSQLQAADLIVGISVGSEDLYRDSAMGAGPDPGASPDTIVDYIGKTRTVVQQSSLSGILIGHVDTWTAWVNGSNNAVIPAVDFIGMNGFPYFQSVNDNTPANLAPLFADSLTATENVAQGKPVWVTETGYPVTGPTYNQAVPGNTTAHNYYHDVGCAMLFTQRNTWWYTLQDAPPTGQTDPEPAFGIVGWPLGTQPLYDLSCAATSTSSSPPSPTQTTTLVTIASSTPTSTACPATLSGTFEFPHLLVPISSTSPTTSYGTQYSASINTTTSTLFNFDFSPSADTGKTCSLIFFWSASPTNSEYTFNGQGGLSVSQLSAPASNDSTWDNVPTATALGSIGTALPGNDYVVATGPCPAGETLGYRVDSTGGLALSYFQEDAASGPIGLFVSVC